MSVMWKSLVGFFVAIILMIVAAFLIFSNKGLFSSQPSVTVGQQVQKIAKYYNTSAVASLTIDGPIVANQNFNEVVIEVSANFTELKIINGYNNQVVSKKVYTNNQNAFRAFLKSLALNNFQLKVNNSQGLSGPIGVCPTGDSYIFKFVRNSQDIVDSWQTSCNSSYYTFGGNLNNVIGLFQSQIPNYNQDVQNLNL
jgi:hypothetical protein